MDNVAASYPKKSLLTKIKMQLFLTPYQFGYYSMPVRVWKILKIDKRLFLVSCLLWLPLPVRDDQFALKPKYLDYFEKLF
jgi:hypothetical protein